MDPGSYHLWSCCIDPMKSVCISQKGNLKITNVCLSDTIQSTQESSRVSLIQDSKPGCVSILEPFQFDQRKLDILLEVGTVAAVYNHGPHKVFCDGVLRR